MGIETLGYKQYALFPMTLHVENINQPVQLDGTLTLSSCTNVCVLTDYQIKMNFIPKQLKPLPEAMHLYNQGISKIPAHRSTIALEQASWDQSKETVIVKITNPRAGNTGYFVDTSDNNYNETTFSRPHYPH